MECAARRSRWQGGAGGAGGADGAAAGRCASVLHEVFRWLGGAELARAGAACRAWRAAAADTALWRRLLASHTSPASLRALREHNESLSWRQEYVNVFAKWEVRARLVTAGDAPLLHAALACSGRRLAVTAEDASVTIWDRTADGKWSELCSTSMRRCGWASAARAQWPADHSRLLVAGPLALADRWELLVLQLDDTGGCRAISRAGCSAGAAGCWARAAGDAFLSLELRRLAPLQACTTVWLNAATQETQSEYAGVTTPILRIYNEESAHITHALVTEVPLDEPIDDDSLALATAAEDGQVAPAKPYYRAVYGKRHSVASVQILVAVSWGESGIVRSWPLSALQPPPLLAATLGDLRARVQARRARAGVAADVPEQDAPEPDEAAVRALCTPPDARRRLGAAVLGLVLHSGVIVILFMWRAVADARG